jgi:hypothetical protein
MLAERDDTMMELAHAAARWVVEHGMEYGPAKARAARDSAWGRRAALPDNVLLEDCIREYLDLFCADTHPAELAALRELASQWMQRLCDFRPHVGGVVWRGLATRHSVIHLHLFCDDAKAVEWFLMEARCPYEVQEEGSPDGRLEPHAVLVLDCPCPPLGQKVPVCLHVRDFNALRGALKHDARGESPYGTLPQLIQRMAQDRDSLEACP